MNNFLSNGQAKHKLTSTRERDLSKLKLGVIIFAILFTVTTPIIIYITKQYPDSKIATAVYGLLTDPISEGTSLASAAARTGSGVIRNLGSSYDAAKESIYVRAGKTPDQNETELLKNLVYVGNGVYSTPKPVAEGDLGACEEEGCNTVVKMTFQKARSLCNDYFLGRIATIADYQYLISRSKHVTQPGTDVWTADKVIVDGFWSNTLQNITYRPGESGAVLNIAEDDSIVKSFYCVTTK